MGFRLGHAGFGRWQQGGPATEELRGQAITVAQPTQLPLRQQQRQSVRPCPDRHGHIEASHVHALVDAADAIFAELGAEGGPSLLGEEEDEVPASKPAKSSKTGKAVKPSPAGA